MNNEENKWRREIQLSLVRPLTDCPPFGGLKKFIFVS